MNYTVWIRYEDFKKIKKYLADYRVFKFNILDVDGVVIMPKHKDKFLSQNEELHSIVREFEHYILSGSFEYCDKCVSYGDEIKTLDKSKKDK